MQDTVIYFATDHAGFRLKNELVAFVRDTLGYEVVDFGAFIENEHDDFTDFIPKAAREVSARPEAAKAIILGGSGQGEAMLANRFHDVRAVVYYGGPEEILTLSREHNDANVLSLGARFLNESSAKAAVALWLRTAHTPVVKYDRRIDEMETASRTGLHMSIVPSLPASSWEELERLFVTLEHVSAELQVDIVDGVFVPHTSWPFTEADVATALQRLQKFTTAFAVEVDCMCVDPLQYLDVLAHVGVQRVIVHAGSTTDYASCFEHAKRYGYKIGLAFTNDVPLSSIQAYIPSVDFVQVMGIKRVGSQGQPFDARTLDTVAHLRKLYPTLEIAVDGAVNESTIPLLLQAGVTRFAPGSAIAKATDPQAAYGHLQSLIGL